VPRRDPVVPHHLSLGRQEPKGDVQRSKDLHPPGFAQGEPRRPPPGFADLVDLTADVDTEEKEMDEAPATPLPA